MISPEEVQDMRLAGKRVHIVDVRPAQYVAESPDIIDGAARRDPDKIGDWLHELPKDALVVAVCAFGRSVGQNCAAALRAEGVDARYMTGGHAAWKAANGPVVPLKEADR
jgi:Fe-Mn family superoxide dismutase